MARSDAFKAKAESPVKMYLNWSSNDKCFTFYDKTLKTDRNLKLPIKLIYLDSLSSIKGFDNDCKSSIYSNEVRSTKNEQLFVRSYKGGELVKGLYQDIKLKIVEKGGHYNASLYVILDGQIVNISMKGSVLQHWSDFNKESSKKFLGNYISINNVLDAKNGVVKYSVPVFEIGEAISEEDSKLGDKLYDELTSYFVAKKNEVNDSVEEVDVEEVTSAPVFRELPSIQLDENPLPF
jgi:hypothetical protein